MCLSKLNQLVYGAFALCAVGLVLGSMFTPGWRRIEAQIRNGTTGSLINETIARGILPFGCATLSVDGSGVHVNATDPCEKWWQSQPGYEKLVVGLMIVALLTTLAALVWNVLTFFCCIGKGGVFRPLPSLAGTATICLLVAVAVFFLNNQEDIAIIKSWEEMEHVGDQNDVSYSFYLAVAALLVSLLNIVVGSLIVQTAERCL